jgi:hypothetical protein
MIEKYIDKSTSIFFFLILSQISFAKIVEAKKNPTRFFLSFKTSTSRSISTYYWVDKWIIRSIRERKEEYRLAYSSARKFKKLLSCILKIRGLPSKKPRSIYMQVRLIVFFDNKDRKKSNYYEPLTLSEPTFPGDKTKNQEFMYSFKLKTIASKHFNNCIEIFSLQKWYGYDDIDRKLVYRLMKSPSYQNKRIAHSWAETTLLQLFSKMMKNDIERLRISYQTMFIHFLQPKEKRLQKLLRAKKTAASKAKSLEQQFIYYRSTRKKINREHLENYLKSEHLNVKFTAAYIIKNISPKKAAKAFLELVESAFKKKKYGLATYILNNKKRFQLSLMKNKLYATLFNICSTGPLVKRSSHIRYYIASQAKYELKRLQKKLPKNKWNDRYDYKKCR